MRKYVYKHKFLLFVTVLSRCLESLSQVYTSVTLRGLMDATVDGDAQELIKWIIISVLVFAAFGLFVFLGNILLYKYNEKTMVLLKENIFKGILRRNYKDFQSNNTADYISELTNDINLVENNYLIVKITRIGELVILLGSVAVMLSIDLWLTLLTAFVSLLILVSPMVFQGFIVKRQEAVSEQFSVFTDKIKDVLMGYEVIKTFKVQDRKEQEFINENKKLERRKFQANKIISYAGTTSAMLSISVQILVVSFAGVLVINGVITAGSLVAVLSLSGQIIGPFVGIVDSTNQINGMKAINKKLIDIAETPDEGNKQYIKSFVNNIRITDLCYSYEPGKPVINHLTCEFKKGKKYAIVGKSGSGKSTLLELIMGYDDNYTGYIWIDGQNMKDISYEARYSVLTIMHQNVYMFSGGIYDNITLGRDFPKEDVERVLKESGVTEFIQRISEDTVKDIGENGNKLSGGQRQRIAIARALLNGSQVLLLDEAMSSLDPRTGRDIEDLILSRRDMTVIAVTHKLSSESLKKYDEVIVLEGGYLAEKGTFDQLMDKGGLFWSMCQEYSKGNEI